MTLQYRICHNCGCFFNTRSSLLPSLRSTIYRTGYSGNRWCHHLLQAQVPYQPQGQGYAPPPTPSPDYPSSYGQQAQMTPGQVGGSPQPPSSQPRKGVSPFLIIALVVVALLVLVGTGSLFYTLGQRNSPQPGTTPTPGITPAPTPTQGTTPVPTPTPKITPGTTPTATAFRALVRIETVCPSRISESSNTSLPHVLFNSHSGDTWPHCV